MQQSLRAVPFSFLPFCPLSSVRETRKQSNSINKIISMSKTNGETGENSDSVKLYEKKGKMLLIIFELL